MLASKAVRGAWRSHNECKIQHVRIMHDFEGVGFGWCLWVIVLVLIPRVFPVVRNPNTFPIFLKITEELLCLSSKTYPWKFAQCRLSETWKGHQIYFIALFGRYMVYRWFNVLHCAQSINWCLYKQASESSCFVDDIHYSSLL